MYITLGFISFSMLLFLEKVVFSCYIYLLDYSSFRMPLFYPIFLGFIFQSLMTFHLEYICSPRCFSFNLVSTFILYSYAHITQYKYPFVFFYNIQSFLRGVFICAAVLYFLLKFLFRNIHVFFFTSYLYHAYHVFCS